MKKYLLVGMVVVIVFTLLWADWYYAQMQNGNGTIVEKSIKTTKGDTPVMWFVKIADEKGILHEVEIPQAQYEQGCEVGHKADFKYYQSYLDNFQPSVQCKCRP